MKAKIMAILVMTLLITTVIPAIGMTTEKKDFVNEELIIQQASCIRPSDFSNKVQKTAKPLDMSGTPFYGYVAYDPNGTLTIGPCSFMPTTPGIINSLAPTSSTDFLSGGTWVNGMWYGCEYTQAGGSPFIWTINEITGAMNLVGSYDPAGTGLNFNGLAYDQVTNKLYGCSSTDLYTVSMSTGASTLVGPFGIGGEIMIGIAFDSSGNLYGTELVTDSLYTINPLSGTAGLVGPLNIDINYAQDMSFDWDTGILYLSAFTISPIWEGALYTCNPGTGATAKVGTFQNGAEITCFAIPYNFPPTPPIIDGPPCGHYGNPYTWTFHSNDSDGDMVRYHIDWGDGPTETTGWFPPCTPVPVTHTYTSQGTFTITAYAEDDTGLVSPVSTYQVRMPRNKAINTLFLQFLQQHPYLFPILQLLLQRLGLQ